MINTGEINVNFACVNRPLRFDPSLVMFCKRLLQSACLSKAYLRAGVLAPNARHLVACATCLPPLGGRDAPLRLIRSSSEKIAIMKLGSTSALPISRAPSPPVDERCAWYKIGTAGGAKRTLLQI